MRKNSRAFKTIYAILIIALLMAVITSCQGKEQKPKPPEEKKDKIPKSLTDMEEKIEDLVKDVEKLQEEIEKPPEPKKTKEDEKKKEEGKEQQSEEDQGAQGGEEGKEKDKEGGGEQGDKPKEEMTKEEKLRKMWEDIERKSKSIYSQWNNYENKAMEDGASMEDIEKFEEPLYNLTNDVKEKKDMHILYDLNSMILGVARFYDFYKGNPDGEALRLRYYVRQIYLDGASEAWYDAKANEENLQSTLERFRQKVELDKEKEEQMTKLSLSVEDYKKVIEKNDKELLKIIRDTVLKNLDKVREEAK